MACPGSMRVTMEPEGPPFWAPQRALPLVVVLRRSRLLIRTARSRISSGYFPCRGMTPSFAKHQQGIKAIRQDGEERPAGVGRHGEALAASSATSKVHAQVGRRPAVPVAPGQRAAPITSTAFRCGGSGNPQPAGHGEPPASAVRATGTTTLLVPAPAHDALSGTAPGPQSTATVGARELTGEQSALDFQRVGSYHHHMCLRAPGRASCGRDK